MENEERIILTVNAKGDTTFCTEALKDMSNEQPSQNIIKCG